MKTVKTFLQTISLVALCAVLGTSAYAQEKVRLAYLKTITIAPFYYAEEKGYFKAEGVDLEMIQVQTPAAAASAVASGSAEIAYVAPQTVIAARAQNQPFKIVVGLTWEKAPESVFNTILASKRSGIRSAKDLVGKTIAMNAPKGACEQQWRTLLESNGIAWDQVKVLSVPFPQDQAMLELGTADAACVVEPFTTSIKQSNVDPVVISEGILPDTNHRYLVDVLFATDTWAQQNTKAIAAIKRALARVTKELKDNPSKLRKILISKYQLPPKIVDALPVNLDFALNAKPSELQPILDSMEKYHMVKPGLKASDLLANTQ